MLFSSITKSLNELIFLLKSTSSDDYTLQHEVLSNATIGEHTRHIIEFFQCLESQYESGIVNYDRRNRDFILQTSTDSAIIAIQKICINLNKTNKKLTLHQEIEGSIHSIESNYMRELLYNFEHCIHHQALIKVGVLHLKNIPINQNFGVAQSTIKYRNKCVL